MINNTAISKKKKKKKKHKLIFYSLLLLAFVDFKKLTNKTFFNVLRTFRFISKGSNFN